MTRRAEFMLAQYLRDPMRREPKNVGLIVLLEGEWAARFLGEREGAAIDKRTIRWAKDAEIYEQWVEHWREELNAAEPELTKRLTVTNGGNFDVIFGGAVSGINGDSAADICSELFPLLVDSDESDPDATNEVEARSREMARDITKRFHDLGILAGRVHHSVPNPIWVRQPVLGHRAEHRPTYWQPNGVPCVMEVVNFMTTRKNPVKDHAGWAAKMFDDIRARRNQTQTIALIRAGYDELQDKTVQYALALLADSASIVNMSNSHEERTFFQEREKVALGPPSGQLPL